MKSQGLHLVLFSKLFSAWLASIVNRWSKIKTFKKLSHQSAKNHQQGESIQPSPQKTLQHPTVPTPPPTTPDLLPSTSKRPALNAHPITLNAEPITLNSELITLNSKPNPSPSIQKLKASSILEVLVSLSLASIVFVIGGMVWLQINGSNAPHREIEQRIVARELIADAINEGKKQDQIFTIGATKYLRKVIVLNAETQLCEITVTVLDTEGQPQFSRGIIAQINAE